MTDKNKLVQRRYGALVFSTVAVYTVDGHFEALCKPASRYRERKKEILQDLKNEVDRLNEEVAHLKLERDSLEDRNRMLGKSLELRSGSAIESSHVSVLNTCIACF